MGAPLFCSKCCTLCALYPYTRGCANSTYCHFSLSTFRFYSLYAKTCASPKAKKFRSSDRTAEPENRYCQLKSLLHELGDFLSEVILTLLNAFALLKAGVAHELDGGTDLLCDSGDVILDGDFVVFDERLLQ